MNGVSFRNTISIQWMSLSRINNEFSKLSCGRETIRGYKKYKDLQEDEVGDCGGCTLFHLPQINRQW